MTMRQALQWSDRADAVRRAVDASPTGVAQITVMRHPPPGRMITGIALDLSDGSDILLTGSGVERRLLLPWLRAQCPAARYVDEAVRQQTDPATPPLAPPGASGR